MSSTPEARALGHLLLLQGGVQLVASEEELLSMVTRGLGRVPGIAAAEVRLGRFEQSGRRGNVADVPIATLKQRYGSLHMSVSDEGQYALYEPFVRNLAGTMALWL